jgi:hypothetical protein
MLLTCAQDYIDKGYAVVSRKYRLVARIDREDWKAFSKKNNYPIGADWYRRCLSKDELTLPEKINIKDIPNSGLAEYEFIPLV